MNIVMVFWKDACSSWNSNYYELEKIKDVETILRTSVGYLIYKDKDKTTIAGDYRDDKTFGKLLTIPTSTIKKIVVLRRNVLQ